MPSKTTKDLMRTKRGTKNGGVFYLETKKKGKVFVAVASQENSYSEFFARGASKEEAIDKLQNQLIERNTKTKK